MSIFFVADTFNMDLRVEGSEALGEKEMLADYGAFSLSFQFIAGSDFLTSSGNGFFAHVADRLWLYLWLESTRRAHLVVFDGEPAGLSDIRSAMMFGQLDARLTLAKLRKLDAIKAVYRYTHDAEFWQKLTARDSERLYGKQ